MKRLSPIALLTLFFLMGMGLGNPTYATHQVGADLTWACTNDGCNYVFTYTFYEDCSPNNNGNPNAPNLSFDCADNSGPNAIDGNGAWGGGNSTDITPLCPGQMSTCNGGTVPGILQFVWTKTINMCALSSCNQYNITWDKCCRSNLITSLTNPTGNWTHTSSFITAPSNPCNNSPVFDNSPAVYICEGQVGTVSVSATDPDGDILQYTMIPCASQNGAQVGYAAGYGPNAPLGPDWNVTMTGSTVTFNPNTALSNEVGVMCVQVDEIRNGRVIGSIVRDMEVRVIPCRNTPPTIACLSPTIGCDLEICVGEKQCRTFFGNDADIGDIVTMGVVSNPTGGTINITGNQLQYCWEPTAADIGTYTVTISATDDACPIPATTTTSFEVTVRACDPCDTLTQSVSWTHTQSLLDITVTNTSNAPSATFTEFCWDDGSPNETYPGNHTTPVNHTFPGPGSYDVCVKILTYIGNVCCHDTLCKTIIVTDDPCDEHEASFTYQSGIIGCSGVFTNTSTPASTQVYWDFGFPMPGPIPTGSPQTVVFPGTGWYLVTMTSVYHPDPSNPDKCCYDEVSRWIYVQCRFKEDDAVVKKTSSIAYDSYTSSLTVDFSDNLKGANTNVGLYGVNGQLLQKADAGGSTSIQLDLSGVPNGVYLLRLMNGDRVETRKFVKQ